MPSSRYWLPAALLLTLAPVRAADPEVVSVEKIWDKAPHNAFTDLIRWKDKWYCTFREGEKHVTGADGRSRVLESADGKAWEPVALVAEAGVDLRDPKLSVTPDGRLMMVMGGSVYAGKTYKGRQPRVAFSKDGREWTAPKRVLTEGEWLWRLTWHGGTCYGVSYNADVRTTPGARDAAKAGKVPPGPADWRLTLVRSTDGEKFDTVAHLDVPGNPSEPTVRVLPDGEMVALVRRELGTAFGWIGRSKAPYTAWTWAETRHRLGGPNFIAVPDGSLWAAGRGLNANAKGRGRVEDGPGPDDGGRRVRAGPDAAQRRGHELPRGGVPRRAAVGELLLVARGEGGDLPGEGEAAAGLAAAAVTNPAGAPPGRAGSPAAAE